MIRFAAHSRVLGALRLGLFGFGILAAAFASRAAEAATDARAVLDHYAAIAQAIYEDAHAGAKSLEAAIDAFLKDPTEAKLKAAREAWVEARAPYQQSEGLRFGNAVVDAWEGRVNSWPLDEGLIDYVAQSYGASSDENPLYTANVIANTSIRIGAKIVDAKTIDKNLLQQLHEAAGVTANVATGYHAVEFLLWGQDLNGTGPGAGTRPASDYDLASCTHSNCDRRAAFLKAAASLLVEDLGEMAADWAQGGKARKALDEKGTDGGLATILTGIGSLSYGELAGERMKLGLILHDPEEEHDCFSDNTHNAHYYNQVGMIAFWRGTYTRTDGRVVKGASLREYVAASHKEQAERLDAAMDAALGKLKAIKEAADSGRMKYDQMLASGNVAGNAMLQDAIDALIAQTRADEAVVASLGLTIALEGSDSLDGAN